MKAARIHRARRVVLSAAALAFALVFAIPVRAQTPSSGGLGELESVATPTATPAANPAKALDPPAPFVGADTSVTAGPATSTTPSAPSTAPQPAATPGTLDKAGVPAPSDSPSPGMPMPNNVLILFGVGAIILVATVIVTLAVVMKNPVVIQVYSRSGGAGEATADGPAPAGWIEGANVRMGKPPEGTLKIQPGRFMVDDGDHQLELRIFRTTGAERVETTIGRDVGSPYRHIQIKAPSVSGKHAKLVFDGGAYSIINYSRTNPTKVNDLDLPENASRRLVDEDRIEIGEVTMTYYET
ncbi:MAG: FHA domain-containing protein [Thermoanaerobaculia bacterium]